MVNTNPARRRFFPKLNSSRARLLLRNARVVTALVLLLFDISKRLRHCRRYAVLCQTPLSLTRWLLLRMCFVGVFWGCFFFHADCVQPEPLAHSHNSALNQIITADDFFFLPLVSFEIHPLASSHMYRVAGLFPRPCLHCSSHHRRKRCLDKFK